MTIAVTGATGRLGGRVAQRLADAGVAQRLLVRDLNRAPALLDASLAQAIYGQPAQDALDRVDTLLMVSAAEAPDRVQQHVAFIDDAAAAGVGHVVYTSFFGASPDATFILARDHWHTEQHLKASGMGYTILRDNLYADFLPGMAGEEGWLRGPAGQGRVAAVAQDDIADVAVVLLRDPANHDGATYNLTGPQALTLGQVAAVLTDALGRTITYHDETVEEAYASRASYGAPKWEVDGWVSTYLAIAAGELDGVTDAVKMITGHPATSLADLLRR